MELNAREALQQGVPVADPVALRTAVDCFRLHRVLDWLSRSREKGFERSKVARLVREAQRLRHLIPL